MTQLCPNPELCGSCGWSHIPYDKQLKQKLADINGSFKLKDLDLTVKDIIASPKISHYRNRMDFVIDWQGQVGLREKGKWWRVIDNHTCFLSDEAIEELFTIVRDWTKATGLTFYDRKANTGFLRYAVIRSTTLSQAMINIITSAPIDAAEQQLAEQALAKLTDLCTAKKNVTIIWSINHTISDVSFGDEMKVISGPSKIEENIAGYKFSISPNAFFQTNPHAAARLLDTVSEFAVSENKNQTLLDLYCGTGFFAISLANSFARTVGVELIKEAIVDAKENAELNNVKVEFHDAKTEDFAWQNIGADVVILDPPRSGLADKALQDVLAVLPEKIVYVSCNYKNFAREMVILKDYYEVTAIRAIDMFPHTPHVELVSQLVRK